MSSPIGSQGDSQIDPQAAATRSGSRWLWFHKLSSPPYAFRTAGRLRPWFFWPALILMAVGLYGGLVLAPPDYQQKDAFRIIYVHVPAGILSLQLYIVMAVGAAVGLIWRIKLGHALAAAIAPIGAWTTFLCLATGSIYGKPMWGTWWQWEVRLTSELIMLFLYLGYMALRNSFDDMQRADRAAAVLAIVGVVNVPIVKFSVEWWSSLHQGPTFSKLDAPSMAGSMVWPWVLMMLAFMLYFAAVACDRVRTEILKRERNASWLAEQLKS
jgi:heme exporter protein C